MTIAVPVMVPVASFTLSCHDYLVNACNACPGSPLLLGELTTVCVTQRDHQESDEIASVGCGTR